MAAQKGEAARITEWPPSCGHWQNCSQTSPRTGVDKRPMPMHSKLYQFVQQHAAGHSNDYRHQRCPPSLPHKKHHQRKHNDPYPFARTKLSHRVQYARECRSKPLMEPRGNSLIRALERVRQTQYRRGSFEEKNGVYHKKAEEVYRKSIVSQLMN